MSKEYSNSQLSRFRDQMDSCNEWLGTHVLHYEDIQLPFSKRNIHLCYLCKFFLCSKVVQRWCGKCKVKKKEEEDRKREREREREGRKILTKGSQPY